jgi:hypothetical protein
VTNNYFPDLVIREVFHLASICPMGKTKDQGISFLGRGSNYL